MSSQGQRPCVISHSFGPDPHAGLCPQNAICVTNAIMTEGLNVWVVQGLVGVCSNRPDSNIWRVGEQNWLILRLCCGPGGRVLMSDLAHPHQSCVLHKVLAQPVPAKMGWLKTHSTANILRERVSIYLALPLHPWLRTVGLSWINYSVRARYPGLRFSDLKI